MTQGLQVQPRPHRGPMLRIHPRPAEEVRVPRVGEMDGFAETGSSYTGAG